MTNTIKNDYKKYNDFAQQLTIIIPAYNEAENVADTIKSIQKQTTPPKEIIVIDDFSSDNTGDVARLAGATVIRPPQNTGTKAGAQNFAMQQINTEFVMAIDADTTLASDAIEKLLPAFADEDVAAVCGTVIPRYINTIWERGRYIEYLFAFTFYKPIQDYYGKPLISSGCFSMYRTKILKECGNWSTVTMAEDMDLTWRFYQKGYKVKFVGNAVCYPIEPHDFKFMKKQLKRWSHGFAQNVKLHYKNISNLGYLRSMITISVWDAVVASIMYLFLVPILALVTRNPVFLLGYVIDLPAVVFPALIKGYQRKEFWKVFTSIPSFFILRIVNCLFILEAFTSEFLLGRTLKVYEKGH